MPPHHAGNKLSLHSTIRQTIQSNKNPLLFSHQFRIFYAPVAFNRICALFAGCFLDYFYIWDLGWSCVSVVELCVRVTCRELLAITPRERHSHTIRPTATNNSEHMIITKLISGIEFCWPLIVVKKIELSQEGSYFSIIVPPHCFQESRS